ncbi:MAG: hypothetical protein LBJ20_05505 [Candidatus Methanoplasma sp.]|nr:hypothetical protein [Candidatus Methanoplasma sp.]
MDSAVGHPDINFRSIAEKIELLPHTDIICFPEACLTGYTSETPDRFSIHASDERIGKIVHAARDNNVTVVFGFIEHCGNEYHITQAVADSLGRLGLYRKTHLGRDERVSFTPGNEIRVFDTPKAKIGIQLCWESHFPEMSSKLRKSGAELILIPYGSPIGGPRRKNIWMKHMPARAADNCVFMGAVNAVGQGRGGTVFGGGSAVLDPKGDLVGEYFGADENVLTVRLLSEVKDIIGSDENMGNIDYFMYRREDLY